MAILEKLRVRAGLLLAIVIGLALLAFVLSDFLDSSGSLFTRSKYEIAEVSGKSVPYTDYETLVNELEEIQKLQSGEASLNEETMDQIRNVTWENMIQDMLLEKQYEKLGIEVPKDELRDLIMGENPHPAIAQLFTDQQTGIFNRQAFNAFMQRINNEEELSAEKKYYLYIENEIFRQRKNIKYLNLLRKGLYATAFEADLYRKESSRAVDASFIMQGFNTLSDSAIQVTDEDIKKHYKENINLFKQKESRDIRYVYFDVIPSEADFQAAKQSVLDIMPDFETAEDIAQFVSMESDESFDSRNYTQKELSDSIGLFMFSSAPGTTYGPYLSDNAYRVSRLASVRYLPDSVKARHILLRATQSNAQTLYQMADSLVNLLKGGTDFSTLAMLYSGDGSAQTGGDLGWFREGEMVQSFSDSCFLGKKGDTKIVASQYGLHVVQIQDQSAPVKKVQIGTIVKKVVSSEETDHEYYVKANEFAGMNNTVEKFNKAIETQNLYSVTKTALNLAPMDKKVNDLESARSLVNWAYKAEEKDISPVFKFGERYVVAVVDKVREEGPVPLKDIRADVENRVRQQKKAESLVASLAAKKADAKTIEDLAKSLGLQPEPVANLRFTSSSLGNAGIEPNVIAAATALEKGVVSDPIIGENGVYVLAVNNITEPSETDVNKDLARNYVERNYSANVNYVAYEALKELAEIRDNRREFY
ncbi:MAG: SurA N-terminal domain-containing protein [Bacteroidales bacterium]|nr:SurA N-terminal domain-containing protein [Bacteroidales bacterium]